MPVGLEHRVIAMTDVAADGPDESAIHAAFENLFMSVGPDQNQCRAEPRAARVRGVRLFQQIVGLGHRRDEIAAVGRFGPIGGIDARGIVQRFDLDPGIICERGKACCLDRCPCFDAGIADEGAFGFFGLA